MVSSSSSQRKKVKLNHSFSTENISHKPVRESQKVLFPVVGECQSFSSRCRLEEYILISKERFGYSTEQALGMLMWHSYNLDKSLADLANFEPLQEEWTCEEKVLFEQAFK